MSDHLVKKHSIKDRNERKYLMDLVRRTYLSMGKSNSSSQLQTATIQPISITSASSVMLPVQKSGVLSPCSPIQDKFHASASNNTNIHQSILTQSSMSQKNHLHSHQNTTKKNDHNQQNLKMNEQINGQQIVYNNNGILANLNNGNVKKNI